MRVDFLNHIQWFPALINMWGKLRTCAHRGIIKTKEVFIIIHNYLYTTSFVTQKGKKANSSFIRLLTSWERKQRSDKGPNVVIVTTEHAHHDLTAVKNKNEFSIFSYLS